MVSKWPSYGQEKAISRREKGHRREWSRGESTMWPTGGHLKATGGPSESTCRLSRT